MAGFVPKFLYKGCHHLSASHDTECTDADTYYKIDGTWTDGNNCNLGFSYDGTGKITYTGEEAYFLLNGVSDVSADKVCTITYGMYLNGSLVTGAETPHTFPNATSTSTIAISNIIKLNKGDYIEVYVKSDTINTTVTSSTLMITLLGDR